MAFYGDQHFTQHGFPSCTCGQYPPVGSTMDTVKSFKAKLKAYMPELFWSVIGPSYSFMHTCLSITSEDLLSTYSCRYIILPRLLSAQPT